MLGNLLPGVREIRAPLIAGYLWLGCVWFAFADQLRKVEGRKEYETFRELTDFFGEVGLAAVLSVAAYFLGSLSVGVSGWMIGRIQSRQLRTLLGSSSSRGQPDIGEILGWRAAATPVSRDSAISLITAPHVRDEESWRILLEATSATQKERLLVANRDLHSEVDRHFAEAEIREAIVLPAPLLIAIILSELSWRWYHEVLLAGVAGSLLAGILFQALQRRRRATDVLVRGVENDLISTRSLDVSRQRQRQTNSEASVASSTHRVDQ